MLITTAHGMFGGAILRALRGRDDVHVRAMVHTRGPDDADDDSVSWIEGDLDRPETIAPAVEGVTDVFVATPMDEHIAAREVAITDAVVAAGGGARIMKIHGAVDHAGDPLSRQHHTAIAHLQSSGLPWTLLSPSSVMETSLLPYVGTVEMGSVFGMSGDGRVGLVALSDVAAVGATALTGDGFEGRDLVVTGPAALTMAEVCAAFSDVLGHEVTYFDLPEEKLADLLMKHGGFSDPEVLERTVLCHLRAWGRGGADRVTGTVEQVTGSPATPLRSWIEQHRDTFDHPRGARMRVMEWLTHLEYGRYAHR
ncbi:MAG: NAD(P)H-binding protein [Thermoleophilia bacterium]